MAISDVNFLLLFVVLLSPSSTPAPVSSPNTLAKIGDILFDQKIQLIKHPGNGNDPMTRFQACLKQETNWNYAEYLFSIEGEELSLQCSPCVPTGMQVHWKKVSFEGEEQPVYQYGRNLLLKSLEPEIIHFVCYWEYAVENQVVPVVTTVWTVERVPIDKLEKISARLWKKSVASQATPHQIDTFGGNERLEVSRVWKDWSECSKCGPVGKRYRVGFCSVRSLSHAHALSKFLALNMYKTPVSCSLLLDVHPEVVSDGLAHLDFDESQEQAHALGRKHVILVAYCKMVVCGGWKGGGSTLARETIRNKIFKEVPLLGEKGKKGADSSGGRRILSLMRNLARGIPIGWSTLPEMTVLVVLISVQIYIIYLIVKSRKEAK